jgi:uncharacterized surface protein with fasciclin (FAS1) repeats
MYNRIKIKNIILLVTLISVLWLSCKKDEEPPVPIGKPIKYNGQLLGSVDSALQKSPYTIFYAAWKKSGIDSATVSAASLTVYVPTDSALTAAGYTASKINTLSKADVDSLVAFHVVYGTYTDSTLKHLQGSTEATTLLTNANPAMSYFNYQTFSTQFPYQYSLFISANDGFWINGQAVKNSNKIINAYRVTLYPINKVLQRPNKDATAILASDPQFSYLMESFRISDSIYYATYNHNPNYDATGDLDRFSLSTQYANLTYFAPTNTAFTTFLAGVFHKPASAVTFQDLNKYQNRVVEGFFSGESSPIDSIIDVYYIQYGQRDDQPYEPVNLPPVTGSTWLYNDLLYNSSGLSAYVLQAAQPVYGYPATIVDLDFITTGGKVALKRHTTNISPPANITQHDIMATNGVIHAVDGLLVPAKTN